jgi:lactate permease
VITARNGQIAGMTLLIQSLPLLALVALMASGQASPAFACLAAMLLSLPAALLMLPGFAALPGFALAALAEGLWLAVIPVGIIAGGLVFHAAVARPARDTDRQAADVPDMVFTAAFLLGPFTESATGFGVGTVFAIGVLRRAGISGVFAALIGLTAQTFIPWGGLGPGTTVGAALADLPAQTLAARSAWQAASVLLLLVPAFWVWIARVGHPVPTGAKLAQIAWVAGTGALLILLHRAVPWELCGMLATGLMLTLKLLVTAPPRNRAGWAASLRAAAPYAALVIVLTGLRLWRGAPSWQPFPDLPGLPLNHAMVAIWLVALALLLLSRHRTTLLAEALGRGRKPAIALFSFVMLARVLASAGIPQALARALAGSFGTAAPYAAPILAGAAGFFGGTNVASNAAMMPLQAALGRIAGLDPVVLPAVQNGTPFLLLSMQIVVIAAGLAGGDATPGRIWRYGWPIAAIALAVGVASIALG